MKKVLLVLFAIIASSMFLASCNDDDENLSKDIELNSNSLTLIHNQKYQLQYHSEGSIFKFSSSNPYVATVNESGLITGGSKGETTITVTDNIGGKATCNVVLRTVYNLYKEPLLDFGCSKSWIKSYETRTIINENETSISYKGENVNLQGVVYTLENSKYTVAGLLVPLECNFISDFISERYSPITYSDGIFYFLDSTKKIAVALKVYNANYWLVAYYKNTTSIKNTNIVNGIKNIMIIEEVFKTNQK